METKGVKSVFGESRLEVGTQISAYTPGDVGYVSCSEGPFHIVFCLDAAGARELAAQLTAVAEELEQPQQAAA